MTPCITPGSTNTPACGTGTPQHPALVPQPLTPPWHKAGFPTAPCCPQHPAAPSTLLEPSLLWKGSCYSHCPLCLIWKLRPSCAPKGKRRHRHAWAAALPISVGCRSSLRRATSTNIVFPCFFRTCKETRTRLWWRGHHNVFLATPCHRKGILCGKCGEQLKGRRAEYLVPVPMSVTPTLVQV